MDFCGWSGFWKNHTDHIDQIWISVVGVGFGRTTLTILTNLWIFVVGVGFGRTTLTTLTKYGFLWLVWVLEEPH